jgi:hypothetical protein
MAQCPALVSKNLCDLTQYLPFQPLDGQMIASFFFGILVVIVFSIDHYKVPTYAKTTIGEFIELAPESLTSHTRYIKGLGIYIALMLGFYAVLLAIGPTAIAPILPFLSEKNVDSSIWPLAATSIITLIGSGNDKYLGRLEGWLRSIAHEAAYIPSAVTNLSGALDGGFPLTEDELRAAGELTPETRALIQESQEGSRQNWIRAKFIYSRLEQLRDRDDQFKQLMKQPENERAFNFVAEQRDALTTEVNRNDRDETVIRKIDAFKNALAVFLASILWRGCDTESAVRAKLSGLKLNVNTPEPQSPATLMFRLIAYLGVATLAWIFVFQIRQMQWHDASEGQKWHLTLAFLVFLLTAFFVTRWREKQLAAGEWKYSSDANLRCAVLSTLAIGGLSALVAFALHQGGAWRFYAMLLVGFAMAFSSSFLFQTLMRWAATSPPTNEAVAAKVACAAKPFELIRTTAYAGALYALVAFVLAFGALYWISQFWIVWGAPQQIIQSANDSINGIKAAYISSQEDDKWFVNFIPREALDDLVEALNAAKADLSSNKIRPGTIPAILARCDALGRLAPDKQILKSGCQRDDYIKKIELKGAVLPLIYLLQGQISSLPPTFDILKNYEDIPTAIKSEWRNALLASLIWAVMAAVFAVSALLYRRHMLWDSLGSKKLPDFVPVKPQDREVWLRQTLYDMGKLSPLEALCYPAFRARLADHMNAQAAAPERPELRIVA